MVSFAFWVRSFQSFWHSFVVSTLVTKGMSGREQTLGFAQAVGSLLEQSTEKLLAPWGPPSLSGSIPGDDVRAGLRRVNKMVALRGKSVFTPVTRNAMVGQLSELYTTARSEAAAEGRARRAPPAMDMEVGEGGGEGERGGGRKARGKLAPDLATLLANYATADESAGEELVARLPMQWPRVGRRSQEEEEEEEEELREEYAALRSSVFMLSASVKSVRQSHAHHARLKALVDAVDSDKLERALLLSKSSPLAVEVDRTRRIVDQLYAAVKADPRILSRKRKRVAGEPQGSVGVDEATGAVLDADIRAVLSAARNQTVDPNTPKRGKGLSGAVRK